MSTRTELYDESMDRLKLLCSLFQRDNTIGFRSGEETVRIKILMIYREDDRGYGLGFEGYRMYSNKEHTKVRGYFDCQSKKGFTIEGWQHMAC